MRDLINTPANDMMPEDLAAAAEKIADRFVADTTVLRGEVLKEEYPCAELVGKGSDHKPCVIDMRWKGTNATKTITLVGKGVCFDTGGYDIKSADGMLTMKKDMGGGAHVLALAQMIMAMNLPINLRVIVPAVDNAINGSAMRPMDVVKTRKGTTVEIGNTDAEGRLILCDALTAAGEEKPDLIIDCATLTGAARIAMGAEVGVLFSNDKALSDKLMEASDQMQDPLWSLPLYSPYMRHMKGTVADLNNISANSYGGAITAALYLQDFVPEGTPWMHLDLMAWIQDSSVAGRPKGGEAMGLRALYQFLKDFTQS